ncbi:MAG TPA: hypothetical protein VM253_00405 [Candidatus Limnocylindrales bacterium]|nr:hypothetical protein [Candidatus Limnocylindrales bacterium]
MPTRFEGAGWRYAAIGLNLAIRAMMVFFTIEALAAPDDDPRFEDKGIGIRNAVVMVTYTMVFPAIHLLRRRMWSSYPWWTDSLWLSILWLDMLGNSLHLYETWYYFDLIPHSTGPGALTVVLMEALRLPFGSSVAIVQIVHILHEAQEYYFDVYFGTENVAHLRETINDLLVGIAGSIAYGIGYSRLRHGRWWPGWR